MKTYFKLLFGLVLLLNYLTTNANTTSQLSNQNTNLQNKQYTLQKTISPKLDGLIDFDNDIVGVAPNGYTLSASVSINPNTGDAFVIGSTNLGLYGAPTLKGVKSSFFIRKYAALAYPESSVCNPIYQCYLQQPSSLNPWNISESYHATAIDASKNNKLYVVGNLDLVPRSDKVSYHDYFFGVYDDNLTQLRFSTSSNSFDDGKGKIIAKSVAADYNGNVYVVGTEDYFLKGVKKNKVAFINTYDEEFFGGYTGEFDYSESADKEYTGIFIDSLNHVLVVENEYEHAKGSSTITQANAIIKKFYKTSQNGPLSEIWQATIKPDQNFGGAAGEVIGYGITTDLYNNVYVVGTTNSSISGKKLTGIKDMFVAKYNESGSLQWIQLLGSQNGVTIASAVTTDYDGKVYVTGSTTKPPFSRPQLGNVDAFIMVYDIFGRPSAFMQEGNQGGITAGQGVAIDNLNDRIYITGSTNVGFLGTSAISTKSNYFLANLWYWEERKNLYFKPFATNTLSFNTMLASTKNNSPTKLVRTSTKERDSFLSWNDIVGVSPYGFTAAHGVGINPLSHSVYIVGATDRELYGAAKPKEKETMSFIRKYEMNEGTILTKDCIGGKFSGCYQQWPIYENVLNSKYIAKAVDASTESEYVVGDQEYVSQSGGGQPVKNTTYFILLYKSNLQFLDSSIGYGFTDEKHPFQIRAFGVAKDKQESIVYVVGCTNVKMFRSKDPQTGISDYYITGINSNTLNPIWARQYGSIGGSACARSVQVDNLTGIAYIAGLLTDVSGKSSAFVEGYTKSGNLFTSRERLGGKGDTRAYGVAIDTKRELLYVVGDTNEQLGNDPIKCKKAMFVAQYSLQRGLELNWVKTFGAADNYWGKTTALSVTVADDEYVYITGFTDSPLFSDSPKSVQHGKTDTFVLVLDNFGSPNNYVQIGGDDKHGYPGMTDGQSIAVDGNKHVFVTGFTDASFLGESVKGLLDYFLTELTIYY